MSRVRRAISAIVTDHRSAFAVVAGIVGAVVGLAAVIFNWLIAVWMRATTGAADYSVTGGAPHGWPAWTHILIIAVPVVSDHVWADDLAMGPHGQRTRHP